MLRYVAFGTRNYRNSPIRLAPRTRWEIAVAIAGRIAPVIPGRSIAPQHQRMWLLPPSYGHGWTGDGEQAQVVMLSPVRVPTALELAAARAHRENSVLTWDMDEAMVGWLQREVAELIRTYKSPGAIDLLRQERLIIEIAIRALSAIPPRLVEPPQNTPELVVNAALAWFREHISEGAGEEEVSRSIHVSPGHMRRLFHRVLGQSPRQILSAIRFERADQLLVSTDQPLARIAESCGYENAAAFGRAYLRVRGKTPGAFRREPPGINGKSKI